MRRLRRYDDMVAGRPSFCKPPRRDATVAELPIGGDEATHMMRGDGGELTFYVEPPGLAVA